MRLTSWIGLLATSFLLLVTAGSSSFAEYDDAGRWYTLQRVQPVPQRRAPEPSYAPAQPSYYGRNPYYPAPRYYQPAPGAYAPSAPETEVVRPRTSPEQRAARRASERARAARREEAKRAAARTAPAAPAPEVEKAEQAEIEPSTIIAVYGDSLADRVGEGLEEAFEEAPDIAVVNKIKSESGLSRADYYDWPKAIQEHLDGGEKVSFAVVMLGSNDRQAIREGDVSHDPLSERWRQIYGERVEAVVKVLADRKIPFIWMSAPPVKGERSSADVTAMNEIYRERVQRAGGIYVDIWPGFVNDENRYTATGPDLEGQVTRLRSSDGVHFTRAGARKAAHFAETELKRLIEARNAGKAVATPGPTTPDAAAPGGNPITNAALPEPQAQQPLAPVKPVAGPVLPLTRPDLSRDGALLSDRPKLDGDAARLVNRALREGVAPAPKPGRADDFTWPRS